MSARRGGKPKRSRPRRDKGGGVSTPSRSRTQSEEERLAKYRGGGSGGESSQNSRWAEVGKRIDVAYDAIGHPQQMYRPVEEGKHYETLAYTDWADTFVPTVVKWNHGAVDSFTDRAKSMENQRKALEHARSPGLKVRVVGTIADLQGREDLSLVTDSQDVQAVKDHLGGLDLDGYDGFLVKVSDGDYTEVYGFSGSVPGLGKPVYALEHVRAKASPRMSQRLKLPAQVRVRGKFYTEHTGAYTIEEAERKARDIRGRGYKATIRRGNYRGQPVYTVYARKETKENDPSRRGLRSGDRVRVTAGSGLDSGKTGIIVDRSKVKTDGRAVPTNVRGAYKPVNWSKEVAVELNDGTLITMPKTRLQEAKA